MSIVVESIKSAYGDFRFLILFGICLAALLILFRGKRKSFVIPAVLITVAILNPLFYQVWSKINEANVYWRSLWMIPILSICAAVPALIVDKTDKTWLRIATVVLAVVVFSLCGSYDKEKAYLPNAFSARSNAEKLPDDVVRVGEELLRLEDHPRVVTDSALSVYLRQYSGKIQMPYARSVTYGTPGTLGRTLYSDLTSEEYESLAQTMLNYDYEYLVTWNESTEKSEALETAGYDLIRQVKQYGIYRVDCAKTEQRTYNDQGQTISITQLDENGNPVNGGNGYATVSYQYDDNGYVSYEFHTDVEDNGVVDSTGSAGYQRNCNYRGWVMEQTWLDAEGASVNRTDTKYATMERKHDKKGNVVREEYFDTLGQPVLCNNGYAAVERVYKTNRLIEERYLDVNNELVNRMDTYYAVLRRQYDADGNRTRESFYDSQGNAVLSNAGYAVEERSYENSNLIEARYLDTNYDLVGTGINNYARYVNEYRDDGELSLSYFYGVNGELLPCGSSYFHKYLQGLKGKTFIISVKDECSNSLTETLAEDLRELGIETDLRDKYRNSFYAIVSDAGIVEDTSQDRINYSCEIDEHSIEVVSSGWNAGSYSSILVDGLEYSKNVRGMNIVVLENERVVDAIAFDTWAFEMNVS